MNVHVHPTLAAILNAHAGEGQSPSVAAVMARVARPCGRPPHAMDVVAGAIREIASLVELIDRHYPALPSAVKDHLDASPLQALGAGELRQVADDMWEG
jgi:hypothetical protein